MNATKLEVRLLYWKSERDHLLELEQVFRCKGLPVDVVIEKIKTINLFIRDLKSIKELSK